MRQRLRTQIHWESIPPKPINLKRDLGYKVALNSKGYPLPSLMLLMSELTGVPIQIDWASFDIVGVDVGKPIKTVGKARSVRGWLDETAKQVDGEVRADQFVMVMTDRGYDFRQCRKSTVGLGRLW